MKPKSEDQMKNLGKISRKGDGFEVRFERFYPFPQQTVWEAITDPAKLAAWFTDISMDFKPGGKMIIRFQDDAKTESQGEIKRIEPPHLFEYTWEEELARWELFAEGTGTKLILTYSRLPDTYADSVPAGWHILLDQLGAVLQGGMERFPFGGEETAAGNAMKAIYKRILSQEYPELKT